MCNNPQLDTPPITIAVPKGRMQQECLELLALAGLDCQSVGDDSRCLLFRSPDQQAQFLLARPTDIPVYVEQGAADLGLCGKDVLLEEQRDVYELLDLRLGSCRFVLAGPERWAQKPPGRPDFPLRVATKFPRIAQEFFLAKQWPVQLIKLHGAVELAPSSGLADLIVDIVSTGKTLAENNLVVLEDALQSSLRLIANRASYVLKSRMVRQLNENLQSVTMRRVSNESLFR